MKYINLSAHIGFGDIDTYTPITEAEIKKLIKIVSKIDAGDEVPEFCDNKQLAELYQRAIDCALDDAADAASDNPFPELGDYDFDVTREYIQDNFEVDIDYPDMDAIESIEENED